MAPIQRPLSNVAPGAVDVSRGSASLRADAGASALGSLFQAGQIGVNVIAGIDKAKQQDLRREITTIADAERQPILDVVAETEELPASVQKTQERLKMFRAAVDQGKLSETQYYNNILTEVRKVRQRNPGYRQIIDNVVRDVVGTDPANALASAAFSEERKLRTRLDSEQAKKNSHARSLFDSRLISGTSFSAYNKGAATYDSLIREAANKQERYNLIDDQKLVDLERDERATQLTKAATDHFEKISVEVTGRLTKQIFGDQVLPSMDLANAILTTSQQKRMDPENRRLLETAANDITAEMEVVYNDLVEKHGDLDFSGLRKMLDDRKASLGALIGDDGKLRSYAAIETAYNAGLSEEMAETFVKNLSKEHQLLYALAKNYPDTFDSLAAKLPRFIATKTTAKTFKEAIDKTTKAIEEKRRLGDVLPDDPNTSTPKPQKDKVLQNNTVIEGVQKAIETTPSPSDAVQLLNTLMPTDRGAYHGIAPSSYKEHYNKLTNPTFVSNLKQRFNSEPAFAERYAMGVVKHWRTLYKQNVDTINESARVDANLRLSIDDKGNLRLSGQSEPFEFVGSDAGLDTNREPEIVRAQEAIDTINQRS